MEERVLPLLPTWRGQFFISSTASLPKKEKQEDGRAGEDSLSPQVEIMVVSVDENNNCRIKGKLPTLNVPWWRKHTLPQSPPCT